MTIQADRVPDKKAHTIPHAKPTIASDAFGSALRVRVEQRDTAEQHGEQTEDGSITGSTFCPGREECDLNDAEDERADHADTGPNDQEGY